MGQETDSGDATREGAVQVSAAAFEKMKGDADGIRRAVIGSQNPVAKLFQAVHLVQSPTERASASALRVTGKIDAWIDTGRIDSVSIGRLTCEPLKKVVEGLRDFGGAD